MRQYKRMVAAQKSTVYDDVRTLAWHHAERAHVAVELPYPVAERAGRIDDASREPLKNLGLSIKY